MPVMIVYLSAIESPEDKVKFEELYHKYRGFMLKVAAQILRGEQDTEDAVHNAFLSIAKNMKIIPELDSPRMRGFIYVVTENKSIDILRERGRREHEEPLDNQPLPVFPEEEHHLAWCISQLPPRYREFILLKYSHGYTTREVADIFGISFAAASKLDQRAKGRLKELCEKEGLL